MPKRSPLPVRRIEERGASQLLRDQDRLNEQARDKFRDDLKIMVSVDFVGRQDPVLNVDREDDDQDHQVAGTPAAGHAESAKTELRKPSVSLKCQYGCSPERFGRNEKYFVHMSKCS